MNTKIMKRLLSGAVALTLTCMGVTAFAEVSSHSYITEAYSIESNKIENIIEDFFTEYERNFDSNIIDETFYSNYFVENKTTETKINLELISTMLYQRISNAQHHYGGETIHEENKKLTFSYSDIEITDNMAKVDVSVTKQFNYNICPNVESSTMDSYSIKLTKECNKWKIITIDNFIPEDIIFSMESQGTDLDNIMSIRAYKNSIVDNTQKLNSEISGLSTNPSIKTISSTTTSTYDAFGAVEYANKYVSSPNPDYFNLEVYYGDCTNFASQVMHEGGGIPQHYGTNGYNNS